MVPPARIWKLQVDTGPSGSRFGSSYITRNRSNKHDHNLGTKFPKLTRQARFASGRPFDPQVFRTGPPNNSPACETIQGNHRLPTAETVRLPRMCHESLDTSLNLRDRRNG